MRKKNILKFFIWIIWIWVTLLLSSSFVFWEDVPYLGAGNSQSAATAARVAREDKERHDRLEAAAAKEAYNKTPEWQAAIAAADKLAAEAEAKSRAEAEKEETKDTVSASTESSWNSWNSSSSSTSSEKTSQKSCEKYKDKADQDYKDYCSNIASCEAYNPTKSWLWIIKIQTIPFTPVMTQWSAAWISIDAYWELYRNYLTSIEQNNSPYLWVRPLEQAKVVYTETQNAIYNCAVLRTKLKVWESILQLIKNNDTSNITQKINSQNKTINKEILDKKCNPPWNKTASYNQVLIENITYHYCNYRFYLNYLSVFPTYNVSQSTISNKVQKPGQDRYNTANALTNLKKQSNLVAKEIEHSKQIYNISFSAFSELESTYGLHIMLLLIYDDYVQIKKNFSKILNPISQLVYKIPQAQGK